VKTDPVLSKELYIAPRDCNYYYGFTMDKPPVDNVLVRKALAAAIDRQSIIDNVVQRPWLAPLSCTTPPKIMGHQEFGACGYAFDP